MSQPKTDESGGILDVRFGWLIILAFVIQLATILTITDPSALVLKKAIMAVTGLLILGGLIPNLRWWGFRVLAVGFLLNALVMIVNGGLMPVTPENYAKVARSDVGPVAIGETPPRTKSVVMVDDETRLAFLSDVVYVGSPSPRVYSVGDIALGLGFVAVFIEVGVGAIVRRKRQRTFKLAMEEN